MHETNVGASRSQLYVSVLGELRSPRVVSPSVVATTDLEDLRPDINTILGGMPVKMPQHRRCSQESGCLVQ